MVSALRSLSSRHHPVARATQPHRARVSARGGNAPYGASTTGQANYTAHNTLKTSANTSHFSGCGYDGAQGEVLDLWFFRARYFDADLGKFITRDPLIYVDGMSMYRAYFAPMGMDPMGLWWYVGVSGDTISVVWINESGNENELGTPPSDRQLQDAIREAERSGSYSRIDKAKRMSVAPNPGGEYGDWGRQYEEGSSYQRRILEGDAAQAAREGRLSEFDQDSPSLYEIYKHLMKPCINKGTQGKCKTCINGIQATAAAAINLSTMNYYRKCWGLKHPYAVGACMTAASGYAAFSYYQLHRARVWALERCPAEECSESESP